MELLEAHALFAQMNIACNAAEHCLWCIVLVGADLEGLAQVAVPFPTWHAYRSVGQRVRCRDTRLRANLPACMLAYSIAFAERAQHFQSKVDLALPLPRLLRRPVGAGEQKEGVDHRNLEQYLSSNEIISIMEKFVKKFVFSKFKSDTLVFTSSS